MKDELDQDERNIIGSAWDDGFISDEMAEYFLKHPEEAREWIGQGEAYANDNEREE